MSTKFFDLVTSKGFSFVRGRVGFFHVSHFSIYLVNALVFNGKAVVERRGFRPKIFDDRFRFSGQQLLVAR